MADAAALIARCLRKEGVRGVGTHAVGVLSGGARTVVSGSCAAAPALGGEPLFEIGSLTKLLTATLLAEMHLRGEVDLADAITSHLPAAGLPRWRRRPPTLEELATHRAALPHVPPALARRELLAAAGVLHGDPWRDIDDGDYRALLRAMRPRRAPGGRVRYSSMGFGLLGDALARRAGGSFEDLLRSRICAPLGLADTGVDVAPQAVARMLAGRSRRGRPRPPMRDGMPAAGSVRSGAGDMLRFLHACLAPPQDPLGDALVLARQPRAKINRQLSIGLGWLVLRRRGRPPVAWHNGGTWGFRSFAALAPDADVAVIVLGSTTRSLDRLGLRLVDALTR